MRNYRDLLKQFSRLQGMAQRLATKVPTPTGTDAKAMADIAAKANELETLLNDQVIKHLTYTQPRLGSVEAPTGKIGKHKHDPEPAIEQVPTT